jgi:small conductance mechanosensitive channel
MENFMDQLIIFATTYGLKVLGAVLILIIGRIVAGVARRFVRKILKKSNADEAIISFAASLTFILIIVFAFIAALAKFGVQTASFVAVMGAAGFAVGFALQGSLSNFAAGVMILIFRPFKVGDFIDAAGVTGVVKEVGIFNTVISTRRVDMVFGIGYGSSIAKAYDTIENILKEDKRILHDPAPQIAVAELADSSVNFVVRPWVSKEDYWDVKFDLTRKVKEQFDATGIEIPFPQHVVHMAKEG